MKKILIPVSIVAILLCASWKEDAKTVSPDRLFLADSGKSLFVTLTDSALFLLFCFLSAECTI